MFLSFHKKESFEATYRAEKRKEKKNVRASCFSPDSTVCVSFNCTSEPGAVLHFSNYRNYMCAMNSLYWMWGKGGVRGWRALKENIGFSGHVFVFAHVISEGSKDISNVLHSWAKAMFLLSLTHSFPLLPSLASFFLSCLLSHILSCCDA